jgi:hypothetical protein
MNSKFAISVAVMFVMSMALGFLVHAVLLGQDYAQLTGLFRTPQDGEGYFQYMLLAHVFLATGFVWVYLQGRTDKPFLAQGIRYGFALVVLMTVPGYLIYYAVQPLPGMLVVKQIVFDSICVVLMGIAVAWLYRKPA